MKERMMAIALLAFNRAALLVCCACLLLLALFAFHQGSWHSADHRAVYRFLAFFLILRFLFAVAVARDRTDGREQDDPAARGRLRAFLRDNWPGLLIASVFFLLFGAHQLRYVHQDWRMQMLTSRFDDSFLLEQIREMAELKTLDPERVNHASYGVLSFASAAAPSVLASLVGLPVSEAFSACTCRLVHALISAWALLAVYQLGARYFSRYLGVMAACLVGTSYWFLIYSNFPFYPDVLQSLFVTLALNQALGLVEHWSGRRLMMAALFCGLATGTKFLGILAAPFIVLLSLAGRRLSPGAQPPRLLSRAVLRTILWDSAVLGAVIGTTFLMINPYLRYLQYLFQTFFVNALTFWGTRNPATPPSVGESGFFEWYAILTERCALDSFLVMSFVVASAALLLAAFRHFRRRGDDVERGTRIRLWQRFLLTGYVWFFFFFICASMRNTAFSDGRVLLLILGGLYLVALESYAGLFAWLTGRLPLGGRGVYRGLQLGLAAGLVALFFYNPSLTELKVPHIARIPLVPVKMEVVNTRWNLVRFFSTYGLEPKLSAAAALERLDFPPDALVSSGCLYTYIPPRYRNFRFGDWQFNRHLLLGVYRPGAYFEAVDIAARRYLLRQPREKFLSEQQWQEYRQGREFYQKLEAEQLRPYVLVDSGVEGEGGNASEYRLFVDRYLWEPNLLALSGGAVLEESTNFLTQGDFGIGAALGQGPEREDYAAGIEGHWPQVVTVKLSRPRAVSVVHLRWYSHRHYARSFTIEGQTADRRWVQLDERKDWTNPGQELDYYVQLPGPQVLARLRFRATSACEQDRVVLKRFAAYAATPLALNNTAVNFAVESASAGFVAEHPLPDALRPVFAAAYAAPVSSTADQVIVLTARRPCKVRSVTVTFFDEANYPGSIRVECLSKDRKVTPLFDQKDWAPAAGAGPFPFVTASLPAPVDVDRIRLELKDRRGPLGLAIRQIHVDACPCSEVDEPGPAGSGPG
jgi:hypothetical protein